MKHLLRVSTRMLLLLLALHSRDTRDAQPTGEALPANKQYDKDVKTWYAVYYAGDGIHLYLAVTDLLQQQKIMMNGMEWWIDIKGRKRKNQWHAR